MERLSQFNSPETENRKGYTIEEVRHLRALNMARREIAAQQIKAITNELANGASITSGKRTIFSKITSSLSYIDYGILAFSIANRIRRMFSK